MQSQGAPFTVVFKQLDEEPVNELRKLARRDDALSNPDVLKRGTELLDKIMGECSDDNSKPKKDEKLSRGDNEPKGYL